MIIRKKATLLQNDGGKERQEGYMYLAHAVNVAGIADFLSFFSSIVP